MQIWSPYTYKQEGNMCCRSKSLLPSLASFRRSCLVPFPSAKTWVGCGDSNPHSLRVWYVSGLGFFPDRCSFTLTFGIGDGRIRGTPQMALWVPDVVHPAQSSSLIRSSGSIAPDSRWLSSGACWFVAGEPRFPDHQLAELYYTVEVFLSWEHRAPN